MFIRDTAVLDTSNRVVKLVDELTDLAIVNDHWSALPQQAANRRDNGRCASAEGLLQRAVFIRLHDFVDGDSPLRDWDAPIVQQVDDAFAGDALQDRAAEAWRHNFPANFEKTFMLPTSSKLFLSIASSHSTCAQSCSLASTCAFKLAA